MTKKFVDIAFWPEYTNPYQELFYCPGSLPFRAAPRRIDAVLDGSWKPRPDAIPCFHLHWLNSVVRKEAAAAQAQEDADRFAALLSEFKKLGGLVVWTLHNLVSHDTPHPAIDAGLGAQVAATADIVLVHGQSAIGQARRLFPQMAGKEVVIPHGHYIDCYANSVDRRTARRRLNIPDEALVLLCLGAVRPYKGFVELLEVMRQVDRRGRDCRVVIAGRLSGVDREELLCAARRADVPVMLVLREIPKDYIQFFLNSADWMVLPYREILTSGSALLAMSFGLPVIAPALGVLPELIDDGKDGLLYAAHASSALPRALERAIDTDPKLRSRMGAAAFEKARAQSWEVGRNRLLEAIWKRYAEIHGEAPEE